MSERSTTRPEETGRLYYGDSWEDSGATMPAAVNGLRPVDVTRRAELAKSRAGVVLRLIDHALAENTFGAVPPRDASPNTSHEEENEDTTLPRTRKVGDIALEAALLSARISQELIDYDLSK